MVCSLTKTAATEAAGRLDPSEAVKIGTLHSHAFRALGSPEMVEGNIEDWNTVGSYPLSTVTDMDDPYAGNHGKTEGDALCQTYHLLRAKKVDRKLWPHLAGAVSDFANEYEEWKTALDLCDFTDLISRGVHAPLPDPPHVIYADECQDHSRLELDLLRAWARQTGRLVIVGDPWQSLYGWRGAYPAMFRPDKVPTDRRHILSRSYRVPRAIHGAALRWARRLSDYSPIEYEPRDAGGMVERLHGANADNPAPLVDAALQHQAAGKTTMICASCSYMLRNVIAELRDRGVPYANPWRTRRGDWNPLTPGRGVSTGRRLLAFLRPLENGPHIRRFPAAAAEYSYIKEYLHTFRGGRSDIRIYKGAVCILDSIPPRRPEPRLWSITDLALWIELVSGRKVLRPKAKTEILAAAKGASAVSECVYSISDWFNDDAAPFLDRMIRGEVDRTTAVDWLRERLLAKYGDAVKYPLRVLETSGPEAIIRPPGLYVGTIHSFKGGEADSVFVLPDLSPSGIREWCSGDSDGIVRMFYVAMTRARESLYLCDPAGSMSAPLWESLN